MHRIEIQSWGHHPVVVCLSCASPKGPNGLVLLRKADSLAFGDVVAAIETHTGEGAHRAILVADEADRAAQSSGR